MKPATIAAIGITCAIGTVGLAAFIGRSETQPVVTAPIAPDPPQSTRTPARKTVGDRLLEARTVPEAIAAALPDMTDESGGKDSVGAVALAMWLAEMKRWRELEPAADETNYALARKDPDAARGKRLCIPGQLVEIRIDRSTGYPLAEGLLMSTAGNLFHFLAAGSTGDLVAQSSARLCGVAIGVYEYPNSGGGTGHAIETVGVFDLPENREKPTKR